MTSVPPETTEQEVLSALKKKPLDIPAITGLQGTAGACHSPAVRERRKSLLSGQYQLKVIEAPTQPQKVKMLRGYLEVTVRHKSAEKVKNQNT